MIETVVKPIFKPYLGLPKHTASAAVNLWILFYASFDLHSKAPFYCRSEKLTYVTRNGVGCDQINSLNMYTF